MCLQLRRPGRAKMLYLLNYLSLETARRPAQEEEPKNHAISSIPLPDLSLSLSLSSPPPCAPTGAASRRQPSGSPCFLPLSRGRCYTHRLLPQPPAWAPCLPGRPFALLPPSYHPRGVPQPHPPFRLPPLPTVSAAPTAPALPQPSPPPDPAPRGNGVRTYPGHRRRWSAPRWPSRCPRGSRRTSAGDPWRCRGGYGGRDGARSPREPLAAGHCSATRVHTPLDRVFGFCGKEPGKKAV